MSDTVKHTTGPWVVDYTTGEILAADRRVASTQSGGVFNLYDANLIAAAPEILDALLLVMSWIKNWDPNFSEDDEWFDQDRPKIEAAIAKAEGRS